ncbi:sulfotransferase family protein [Phytomonospora sp. NPDC050363]|uniref:sulfotransferase family protein n=1 Tax=Phytomonospora sp. NPDC050363 TaxID=3155642 RepID=UPI0033C1CF4B
MLRVIGAGLPRTGTTTLRAALGTLLGGRCYHMTEVFDRREDIPEWQAVVDGDIARLPSILGDFTAAVDWPSAGFWPELADLYPDALILLSVRDSGAAWWSSMDATIMGQAYRLPEVEFAGDGFLPMVKGVWRRVFGELFDDPASGAEAYERYVAQVRATAPKARLLEWNAKQGWGPLCEALGVAVPDEPFPHLNTREEWSRPAEENAV